MSMTTFNSQMGNYLELTKTLRMSRYDKIIKIIIPLSRPAIFIGMSLVAMETSPTLVLFFLESQRLLLVSTMLGSYLMIFTFQIFSLFFY